MTLQEIPQRALTPRSGAALGSLVLPHLNRVSVSFLWLDNFLSNWDTYPTDKAGGTSVCRRSPDPRMVLKMVLSSTEDGHGLPGSHWRRALGL